MFDDKIVPLGKGDFRVNKRETCFNGYFQIDKYYIEHKQFAGGWSREFTREIFERGDAVVMLPYDPERDAIVFNVQFRAGAVRSYENPWLLEFVAGMFGADESPVEVAVREAEEEAGLTINSQDVEFVMEYLSSPGGTSERIHLYVAKADTRDAGGIFGLDCEDEDIYTLVMPREEAVQMLVDGKISNASTIIALQWLAMNYQSLQQKWA